MKDIAKDEMYSWMPSSYTGMSDAQIPDELHKKLCDVIQDYRNVCNEIYNYLNENPQYLRNNS